MAATETRPLPVVLDKDRRDGGGGGDADADDRLAERDAQRVDRRQRRVALGTGAKRGHAGGDARPRRRPIVLVRHPWAAGRRWRPAGRVHGTAVLAGGGRTAKPGAANSGSGVKRGRRAHARQRWRRGAWRVGGAAAPRCAASRPRARRGPPPRLRVAAAAAIPPPPPRRPLQRRHPPWGTPAGGRPRGGRPPSAAGGRNPSRSGRGATAATGGRGGGADAPDPAGGVGWRLRGRARRPMGENGSSGGTARRAATRVPAAGARRTAAVRGCIAGGAWPPRQCPVRVAAARTVARDPVRWTLQGKIRQSPVPTQSP